MESLSILKNKNCSEMLTKLPSPLYASTRLHIVNLDFNVNTN